MLHSVVGPISQHQDQKTVRLSNNVLRGFGDDDVFLSACIVIMLNMMAVQDKNALRTLLTMSDESKSWRSSASVIVSLNLPRFKNFGKFNFVGMLFFSGQFSLVVF